MSEKLRYRHLLDEVRRRTAARIDKTEAALDALTRARRSESDDDEHDPEGVPLSAEWSRLAGLLESANNDLRQVDAALDRLAAGSYGTCVACGKAIPVERLEARPFADRCVPCANKLTHI